MSAEAGFFLEFAIGGVEDLFARLHQALGQRQLVVFHAAAVFFDEQGAGGVLQSHHHHRAMAGALVGQALVGALLAVGEAQLHLLDGEQTALGHDLPGEDSGFLAHGRLLGWADGYDNPPVT
ncbi:hypothetical protein QE440_002477 [Pseudomonas psychrotolerans]|uniref:Uncharacterized protein n=1 Tax=Pseudomonas oryzihabitans TaxID=47885 RepID=A0AAJ2BI80_9PSED|nr:hypothetical protein [Pseudomonas psychrotolerans]